MADAQQQASSIIDPAKLTDGHTLSFADQPYLGELFRELTESDRQITLVVGAGVSMDAGLPSWGSLISTMASTIGDEGIRTLALADDADLMRKAEIVLELIESDPRNRRSTVEIVRDALYASGATEPGELADSIGRLAAAAPSRFRIITTNFDELLETAIENYLAPDKVRPFGLNELDDWREFCDEGNIGVLHVHGLAALGNRKSKEPIVLTESQFLAKGPDVRTIIKDEAVGGAMVFIGVSMTDPNLVGPLWDLYKARTAETEELDQPPTPRFALLVPGGTITPDSAALNYRYFVEKSRYLDKKLTVRPIFLKSYSQLVQAISDMALALVVPKLYARRAPRGQRSLRYGVRFREALNQAYESIGCAPQSDVPVGPQADNLSNMLGVALSSRSSPLSQTLNALRQDCRRMRPRAVGTDEKFGFALWLRARERGGNRAPYAIRLVGTSFQTYAAPWAMPQPQLILPGTSHTIAETLFHGMTQARYLAVEAGDALWRGMLATPITVYGVSSSAVLPADGKSPLDRLTVGVAVLYTTHEFVDPASDGLTTTADNGGGNDRPADTIPRDRRSILSYAQSVGRYAALAQALRDSAVDLLFPV